MAGPYSFIINRLAGVHSPFNARTVVEMKAGKIINIKQSRCGGLTPARKVHDIAQVAGAECLCGGTASSVGSGRSDC